jgi:hypothetical protein
LLPATAATKPVTTVVFPKPKPKTRPTFEERVAKGVVKSSKAATAIKPSIGKEAKHHLLLRPDEVTREWITAQSKETRTQMHKLLREVAHAEYKDERVRRAQVAMAQFRTPGTLVKVKLTKNRVVCGVVCETKGHVTVKLPVTICVRDCERYGFPNGSSTRPPASALVPCTCTPTFNCATGQAIAAVIAPPVAAPAPRLALFDEDDDEDKYSDDEYKEEPEDDTVVFVA